MKRDGQPVERRWREGGGDATEREIGGLMRQVAVPGALPEGRLQRVGARLGVGEGIEHEHEHEHVNEHVDGRMDGRRWRVRVVLVVVLALGGSGVVFARQGIVRWWGEVTRGRVHLSPATGASGGKRASGSERTRASASLEKMAVLPRGEDGPEPSGVSGARTADGMSAAGRVAIGGDQAGGVPHRRASRGHLPRGAGEEGDASGGVAANVGVPGTLPEQVAAGRGPASVASVRAGEGGLGEEARIVRRAIEELRDDRDPVGALASLDEHRARFPGGVLRAEAEVVRVQALLALHDDEAALALLAPMDLGAHPRGDELGVMRGELRAARDCGAAIADFDRVLGRAAPERLLERALRGRAVCRLRLGGRAAAEEDLRAYLARFPSGAFAAEARRQLGR
jgi:hypothetical protein